MTWVWRPAESVLIFPVHPLQQRSFQRRRRTDAGQPAQGADGGRQRPHECLAGAAFAQVGLKRRPFVWFEVVIDVGGRVISHVITVEFSLPEVSFYRIKQFIRPRSILSWQPGVGQHPLPGDVLDLLEWSSSQILRCTIRRIRLHGT